MILDQIIEAFDAELDRLHKLRAIIAGLLETSSHGVIEQAAGQQPEAAGTLIPETTPKRMTRPRLAARTVAKVKPVKATRAEATPLSGPIPKGPVVVMPAALAKELASKSAPRAAKAEREKVPEPGSLGSMIRALHLERLA